MAGVYGDIDSRADFFQLLDECIQLHGRILSSSPQSFALQSIGNQLAAMRRITDQGRTPTDDERTRFNMGLIAARELEPADTDEMSKLLKQLPMLESYIEDWPTDEVAANATDDDWWESDT